MGSTDSLRTTRPRLTPNPECKVGGPSCYALVTEADRIWRGAPEVIEVETVKLVSSPLAVA